MSSKNEIVIKAENFYDKVQRICHVLNNDSQFTNVQALIVNLGLVKDDDTQPKTCLFHLWLLAYEFSETIIGFTRNSLVVLTSNRKKQILEKMEAPSYYKGPKLEVILRDPKEQSNGPEQNY
jgi:nucleosome binding factor SPN SPT16 subunit